jgi:chromosome segregation ATPase
MKINQNIKERIINIANTLVAEGVDRPTNDQVRERMGGGSLSHISPVMREWRESRKAEIVAALEMPSELKKVVETSLGQVWASASKLATASVEKFRLEAETAMEDSARERDEALAEIQRLEGRIADLEKAHIEKVEAANQVKSELEKEKDDNAKLTANNAALQARIEDRDAQIKELKSELSESRSQNKHLQEELIVLAKGSKKS